MNPYEFISQFKKYGKKGGFKPGLERVKKILSYLDNPQDKVNYIHIAGSNGKGSTAAMLTSILKNAGYKVGTYISPPLVHFNERFKINNIPISTKELEVIVSRLEEIFKDPQYDLSIEEPSFFEIITVIAFLHFYERKIDIGILEVGLGGRLDATNVIKNPLISIITNISYEHAEILGPKIEQIAFEKAGIIKYGSPVITAETNKKVLKVFEKKAAEKNSELIKFNYKKEAEFIKKSLEKQIFNIKYENNKLKHLKLNILGEHQIKNAGLAIRALESLPTKYPVKIEDIYKGLEECRWPGRLEMVQRDPDIILDGAHNEDGMKRLVEFLNQNVSSSKKIIFLLSILKDKNYKKMIDLINNLENKNLEIYITANKNERTLKPSEINKYVKLKKIKSNVYPNIYTTLKEMNKNLVEDDLVCITGSLYTVAEARFYIYLLSGGGLENGQEE
ncbi:MAG: bifunctional folylpolyglutamate synthase/dihydrofolate synthase [Halanaerobiales bacterium]|nr:bifunctional folylpolyglutamate synthase/dihydrofolate synthase [Halanaerobiales bacterium]